jgi:hypothetical protein
VVALGAVFGHSFFRLADTPQATQPDLVAALANWDGGWYKRIVEEGYQYDTGLRSNAAFFPAYPILGWIVAGAGLRVELALVCVANVSLGAAFVVLAVYLRHRRLETPTNVRTYALLAFGLVPITFFWRMAYSESLFLFLGILSLYAMERRWPLVTISLLVGLTTATRSVGVALLLPFALYIREVSTGKGQLLRRLWLLPVACWGLASFCLYLYWKFDEPLAFAYTQEHWRQRGVVALSVRVVHLLTLDPIVANFDPSCPCYWGYAAGEINPFFSLQVANPLYWLAAVGLVTLGGVKSWLSAKEMALAFALVFIPYVLKGHETCLQSMGRYVSVAFPVYLVLGRLLAGVGRAAAMCMLGVAGFLLGVYAAMFVAWYRFF